MSEQIREQVSAFLDGELPNSETELLLKRLTRDVELRESFGRYALIGESLRGGTHARLTQGFAARVNRAIDGAPAQPESQSARIRSRRWWRPLAGAAVAAGVAAVAVVSFQERAIAPTGQSAAVLAANSQASAGTFSVQNIAVTGNPASGVGPAQQSGPREALSYTVPVRLPDGPTLLPAARLTNYVFAHSRYSAVMGQNDVLTDLLSDSEAEDAAARDASRNDAVAP